MQPLATIFSFLVLTVYFLLTFRSNPMCFSCSIHSRCLCSLTRKVTVTQVYFNDKLSQCVVLEFDADSVSSFFHNDSLPVSCNVRFGIDWYHGDMIRDAIENILNPGDCCTLCRNQPGCRAWIWRSARSHCWLKHTANRPTPCSPCIGGVLHDVVPEICNPRPGRSLSGPNLEVRIGTTLGDCCDACYQNDGCTGWTFNNTNSPRCFLKQRNEEETNCANCISGENEHRRPIPDRCNNRTGVDWYGNGLNVEPYTNVSAAGCCEMCENEPECRAWWYETARHHCYLKYAVGVQYNCSHCIGGVYR